MMRQNIAAALAALMVLLSACAPAREHAVGTSTAILSPVTAKASDTTNTGQMPREAVTSGTDLATFSTSYKGAVKSRAHNIGLAAEKMNGHVVQPGQSFSFNEAVGPTTKQNGFMLGRIFVKGRDSKGYGGGVCQVSSTLFNAAEAAGMEITERHEHSKPVDYVAEGRDAATSHGAADLKFVNNQPYAVRIKSHADGETVTVTIAAA